MSLLEALYFMAPIIGLGTLAIGILAVFQPERMSKKFGIAISGLGLSYVVSTGIRDIFIGLTVLILFYLSEWLALGYINLCIGIVAISDFLVVLKHGDKKTSLVHLFGTIIVVAYGTWLICQ